jgi:hypothetical protein
MPKVSPVQWNFIRGQVGKKYRGQIGSTIYPNAFESSKNVVVTPQGGLIRRPGFLLPSVSLVATSEGRIIPFQNSSTSGYYLIFSDATGGTIKVYSNADVLKATITSSGITGSILSEFDFDQSFDTIFITHRDFSAGKKKIVRTSDTSWAISDVGYKDGPWEKINLNKNQKLDPSAVSGVGITISAKDKAGTAIAGFFVASDIGRQVRIRHTPAAITWGAATITAVAGDGKTATATVQTDFEFGATTGVKNWKLGALTDTLGFEDVIAFRGNRLYTARDRRIFGTVANEIDRYSPDVEDDSFITGATGAATESTFTVTDDSAIDISLLNLKGAKIEWLFSDQVLHVGTNNGHYILRGANALGPITPFNASLVAQSRIACSSVKPVAFDNVFFTDATGKKLYRVSYNFKTDRYEPEDMTYLADDILNGKVKKLVKMTYPWNMIWAILEDGKMACLTYDSVNEVAAWTYHQHALGDVKDATVIRDTNGVDRLYVIVNYNSAYYIEKMGLFPTSESTTTSDYTLLDGTYVYVDTGPTTAAVTGMTHLNGVVPDIVRNCIYYPQTEAVSAGGLTLATAIPSSPSSALTFQIGKNFDVQFTPLPIDTVQSTDSTVGHKKQAAKILVGLFQSLHLAVQQVNLATGITGTAAVGTFRDVNDDYSSATALFTGLKEITPPQIASEELQFKFFQTKPAPLFITHIGYHLEVHKSLQ